jgi:M6 family metalloprotease-like protein
VRYFSAISNGRFTFTAAGNGVYGPLNLTKEEMDAPTKQRFLTIMRKLVEEGGFNIDPWDINADSTVDNSELIMLVIDSDSVAQGVTGGTDPGSTVFNGHSVGWSGRACACGHRSSYMGFCHELLHALGIHAELYGSAQLNKYYTTMGPTTVVDDRRTFHLDPFHKMKLGWCEPRLYDANAVGSVWVKVHRHDNADAQVLLYDGHDESSRRFFMLEYRNSKVPFDEDVGSNGIAVWRVELDANLQPFKIPGSNNKTDWTVNIQGPPSWRRGQGPLWLAGKTPYMEWIPKCSLNIHPFQDYAGQVQVDVTLP